MAAVLAVKACVQSAPYDIPPWLGPLLVGLLRAAKAPQPLRSIVRCVASHPGLGRAGLPVGTCDELMSGGPSALVWQVCCRGEVAVAACICVVGWGHQRPCSWHCQQTLSISEL